MKQASGFQTVKLTAWIDLEVIKLFSVLKKFLKYMAHYFNTVKLNITFLQKSLLMFTFVYLKVNLEVQIDQTWISIACGQL